MNMPIRPIGDTNPDGFQFTPEIWVHHPQYDWRARVWAKKLVVKGPFTESALYELAQVPPRTWEDVEDDAGNQVPLAVFVVDDKVVYGRWKLTPGAPPLQRDPLEKLLEGGGWLG